MPVIISHRWLWGSAAQLVSRLVLVNLTAQMYKVSSQQQFGSNIRASAALLSLYALIVCEFDTLCWWEAFVAFHTSLTVLSIRYATQLALLLLSLRLLHLWESECCVCICTSCFRMHGKDRFAPPLSQPNKQASCLAVIQHACIDFLAVPGLLGWLSAILGSLVSHICPKIIGQFCSKIIYIYF